MAAPPAPLPSLSGAAAVAETHISIIFFVGDRAYKMKKPVEFPFADFRTREVRQAVCHREVELNRRLAPDVYLGVADMHDPDGQPCEHLVVMRRMPDERRLARLVLDDDPSVPGALDALAAQLATFHAGADRSPVIDRAAAPAALGALWAENFDELRPFSPAVVDPEDLGRAEELAYAFLAERHGLFLDRIAEGQVCDGHGDLQADDVFCLDDGPRALDCIEFFDGFRFGDVAGDIAFLAMDLERLGAPHLAARFVAAYETAAGSTIPPALLHLYVAYRAQVRAKVACLRAAQQPPGSDEHDASAAAARDLLALCLRHLEATHARLVVVGGLPGTGKSTVAHGIGEAIGATVIRSDVVRKQRAGLDPGTAAGAPFGAGIYTAAQTEAVYEDLFETASATLATGTSVVLDASFAGAEQRRRARQVAARHAVPLVELRCVLDPDEAAARIGARHQRGDDASDATAAIATAMAATFDAWPEATEISTDALQAEVARRARTALRSADR
jgi:aminoglycoside phosphotransferase family enzyme/predicted kinase